MIIFDFFSAGSQVPVLNWRGVPQLGGLQVAVWAVRGLAGADWRPLDNTEVSFFPPRVQCECEGSPTSCSGDALILNIKSDKEFRGNYCDYPSSNVAHFICEAVIWINFSLQYWSVRLCVSDSDHRPGLPGCEYCPLPVSLGVSVSRNKSTWTTFLLML